MPKRDRVAEQEPGTLTAKQEAFCREYMVDRNAAAAARRAGYSQTRAKVSGAELLRKATVLARVRQLQQEQFDALGDVALSAWLALAQGLADPGKALFCAKAILDIDLKKRALDIRERELALKRGDGAHDAARVVYVERPPAKTVEEWNERVAEELANVRGSAKRH